MNYEITKLKTPITGEERHQLRIWNFGPKRTEKKQRFDDKKELFKELAKLQGEEELLFNPPVGAVAVKTFGELLDDHKARQQNKFKAGWLKNLKGYSKEFESLLFHLPYTEITPDLLKSVEKQILAKGNSQKTANLKIGWIKSVMSFAWEMDKISDNTSGKFRMTKPPKPAIEFWVKEDAEDFLKFASLKYPKGTPDRWKYVVYLVGMNAGLRAGEIWALKPRCLKRSMGIMYIEEQWDAAAKDFDKPKGKGPRNVPLNAVLADELEALIEARGISRNSLIFPNRQGLPMCHDNFKNRTFDNEFGKPEPGETPAKKWDGPQIKFHGLRHTFGTLMMGAKIDVKTLQEVMGHADLSTTMKYVHAISANVKLAGETFSVKPAATKLKVVKEV